MLQLQRGTSHYHSPKARSAAAKTIQEVPSEHPSPLLHCVCHWDWLIGARGTAPARGSRDDTPRKEGGTCEPSREPAFLHRLCLNSASTRPEQRHRGAAQLCRSWSQAATAAPPDPGLGQQSPGWSRSLWPHCYWPCGLGTAGAGLSCGFNSPACSELTPTPCRGHS